MNVAVFCPARNEGATIGRVIDEIKEALPAASILVVDNASADDTAVQARERGAMVLSTAIDAGMFEASVLAITFALENQVDVLVQVDADGQHEPAEIHRLLEPIRDGLAGLVIGSRFLKSQSRAVSLVRSTGVRLFSLLTSIAIGKWISDTTSGFRAYHRDSFLPILGLAPRPFLDGTSLIELSRAGIAFVEVPATFRARKVGRSHFTPRRSAEYTLGFGLRWTSLIAGAGMLRPWIAVLSAFWSCLWFFTYCKNWISSSATIQGFLR